MRAQVHMKGTFTPDTWRVTNDRGSSLQIGSAQQEFAPYDLLLSALEGCLFATFRDVAEKMKVTYERAELEVSGYKRDEDVATLEECTVSVRVKGASDQKKVSKAFEIASRYCSVFQTLSKVASMKLEVSFE